MEQYIFAQSVIASPARPLVSTMEPALQTAPPERGKLLPYTALYNANMNSSAAKDSELNKPVRSTSQDVATDKNRSPLKEEEGILKNDLINCVFRLSSLVTETVEEIGIQTYSLPISSRCSQDFVGGLSKLFGQIDKDMHVLRYCGKEKMLTRSHTTDTVTSNYDFLGSEPFVPWDSNVLESMALSSQAPPTSLHRSQGFGSKHGFPCLFICSNVPLWNVASEDKPGSAKDGMSDDIKQSGSAMLFETLEPNFQQGNDNALLTRTVERHAVVVVSVRDSMVQVASYNMNPTIINLRLHDKIRSMVKAASQRDRFLNNVLHSKMGLAYHTPPNQAKVPQVRCETMSDLKSLLETTELKEMRKRDAPSGVQPNIILQMQGTAPEMPMHDSHYSDERDAVRRHGLQAQEIAIAKGHNSKVQLGLDLLQQAWQLGLRKIERVAGLTVYVADIKEVLDVKKAMRPLHYCATPILFNPHELGSLAEEPAVDEVPMRPQSPRCWHTLHHHSSSADAVWHLALLNKFRELYVRYAVEHLKFAQVCLLQSRRTHFLQGCTHKDMFTVGKCVVCVLTSLCGVGKGHVYTASRPLFLSSDVSQLYVPLAGMLLRFRCTLHQLKCQTASSARHTQAVAVQTHRR